MVAILFILTVIVFLTIDYIMKRKEQPQQAYEVSPEQAEQKKPASIVSGTYYHPTHTWARVTDDVVTVGIDQFAKKVFGKANKIDVPKVGAYLRQGQTAWKLYRGKRALPQSTPIEGNVVDVNVDLLNQPSKISATANGDGWILKIKPNSLRQNLKNLLHGKTADWWLENSRAQFVTRFAGEVGPVCQDGGEIIENAGDLLTDKEWEEVLDKFFMAEK